MKTIKAILFSVLALFIIFQTSSSQGLISPPNGAAVIQPIQFVWHSMPGTTYHLLRIYHGFEVIYQSETTDTTWTATNLGGFPDPVYHWDVTYVIPGIDSITDAWLFTLAGSLPFQPILYNPLNNSAQPTSVSFNWFCNYATKYWFQLSTDSLFNNLIVNDSNVIGGYTISGLSNSTFYWWRTRGINSHGMGPWSLIWHFYTIPPAPPAPLLFSPPNNSGITLPYKFTWYKSPGAVSYEMEIAPSSNFTTVFYNNNTSDSFLTVTGALPGTSILYWHARAIGNGGSSPWSACWSFVVLTPVKFDNNIIPAVFKLHDNYPNPFNPSSTIKVDIPKRCEGKLALYNMLGEEVETLINSRFEPGVYNVTINGNNLSSGIYLIRFISDLYSDTKKIVLLK